LLHNTGIFLLTGGFGWKKWQIQPVSGEIPASGAGNLSPLSRELSRSIREVARSARRCIARIRVADVGFVIGAERHASVAILLSPTI